ncbi:MAG: DNA polymerase III subunit alpha [Deltaproteobacteria bacterium RBG_13_43_22]|nr:MAG: DNA polymerase III subunit alpha [Deltaproteobacteria bacterium RBG_13_43_22]
MPHASFVHLHLHTQYSLLDGEIRLKELFEKAQAFKLPAVAMTDHGNLFGMVEFYKQAQKHGLKPIIGCEVYVAPESRRQKESHPHQENAFHLVLLCKNEKGYRNLVKLVTQAYFEGFYYKPRIDRELLREYHKGLIAMTACLHGEIPSYLLKNNFERALKTARELSEIFDQDRFYLELQKNDIPEQEIVNQGLLEIHQQLGIPIVATNDCHYLTQEEAKAHDVLLCIQTGKTVDDPNRLRFSTNQLYFKSPEEMTMLFADLPEAIENTLHIADRCNLELTFGHSYLPRYPLPQEETMDGRLKKEARSGLEERLAVKAQLNPAFPPSRYKEYRDRLEKELSVITSTGFSGYFLVVSDYVRFAKGKGIPVGPGRGSGAGSLVAFSVKITDIDPLDYGLIFERFLNMERKELPDIDVDFCVERRDEVLKYITEKYGQEYVAQIITFGKMQARAVIRDVGRALNIPYGEVDKIAKLIPSVLNITLSEALDMEPRLKELKESDPNIKELLTIAEALEGLPRHASTHAAGVVISPHPITETVPLYKGPKGETLTQYEMKSVQEMGLIKFDLLGLNNLTIIEYTLRAIERTHGQSVDLSLIPLDDPATYELLGRGDTTGVFQLESSGMKDLLIRSKPQNFEDLIALNALYRPGPLKSGMVDDYVRRKHREVPVAYPHPLLEEVLKETMGIIVYQEQVMQIAALMADYSMGEADTLRKAMGKKIPEVMAQQRSRFLEGTKKRRIDQKKADDIFDKMETFGGYGFNKSHSAAYALITYQTAYLKAHYPLDFMVALMTSKMGNSAEVTKCIAECREKGIVVLPPDVNLSHLDFKVVEDKIRFGLAAVKNVGAGAIESILEARDKGGEFKSLIDFCRGVDLRRVNRRVAESLIKCGAFDSLGVARARLMAFLPEALDLGQQRQKEQSENQFSLFAMAGDSGLTRPEIEPPLVEEWRESQKLSYEKEILGFYITGHPLTRYAETLQDLKTTDIQSLSELEDKGNVRIAGMVAALKEINSKKGERMAFATIEDLTGSCEIIVFSDPYRKCSQILKEEVPLWVTGIISKDEKGIKVIANEVLPLAEAEEKMAQHAVLKIAVTGLSRDQILQLKAFLKDHTGSCPVQICACLPDKSQVLLSLPETGNIRPSSKLRRELKGLSCNPVLEVVYS